MSTPRGTKRSLNVPRAVLQHVRGYDSRGKRSRACANTKPHPRNEIAPMQRKHLTAPQHVPGHVPGHATVPLRSQHVPGHETGPNCSPRHATARGRPRNAGETFPGACWMKMKPHPCNETAPMQRCPPLPARPRSCNCAPPLPSTSPGTRPAPTVPRAVPQHVGGYDSRGKHSPCRACKERNRIHATKLHPCNEPT